MTIRQIADAAGCSVITVRRVGKMLYPNYKAESRGMAIDYNQEQSIKIMDKLPKKNYINNPTQMITPPLSNDHTSSLTQKDFEMIGAIVANVMMNMENRVSNIEQRFEERKALLPPPEMEPRQQLKKIVNEYCGRTKSDFREAWNDLYREFNYLYHCNVQLNAKNRNIKGVDYVENVLELLPELISVATKLFSVGQLI